MNNIPEIHVTENHLLHSVQHGVPKGFTLHPNGHFFYVDIREGKVLEFDPRNIRLREFPCLDERGEHEFTTAIGLDPNGWFIVARQSGVYAFNPIAHKVSQQWKHLCDILGVVKGGKVRPNNGAIADCSDNLHRFFLGTGAISGEPGLNGEKPGILSALNYTDRKFHLDPLTDSATHGMVMVNSISSHILHREKYITFADSHRSGCVFWRAQYMPLTGTLTKPVALIDAKNGEKEATDGRLDGTWPIFSDRYGPCVTIAMIDTNQIHIRSMTGDMGILARIMLPPGVTMPTMAAAANIDGQSMFYITTLAPAKPPGSLNPLAGRVYAIKMPSGFTAYDRITSAQSRYPKCEDIKISRPVYPCSPPTEWRDVRCQLA